MIAYIARNVVAFVVTTSVGTVVGNAARHVTPADATRLQKVSAQVGACVISSLAGAVAAVHVNNEIDQVVDQINNITSPEEA